MENRPMESICGEWLTESSGIEEKQMGRKGHLLFQGQQKESLKPLAMEFLARNYDYVWLKTMLRKAGSIPHGNGTLITGPSYAIFGIEERLWENAVNCSVDSQDIYYDFLCAKRTILSTGGDNACFNAVSSLWDISVRTRICP